ncbi:MAG: SDR family oxidoreductase [Proteobacteria bacterium]|nr:SDR family oxidoreductase [Pseudomonadota bacterium]
MKILILGAGGMLGHQLCRTLGDRFEIWGTFRGDPREFERYGFIPQERIIGQVDVQDFSTVRQALDLVKPDVVINGIGIVKQRDEAKQAVPSIQINALFPHQLADLCVGRGIRVLQISTDCVFSGLRGNCSESDVPNPVDLYGHTKLLGELNQPGALTLRTSIIGWQLNNFSGLLSWFALQRGKNIKGYRKAIYSGVSTAVLSALIGDIIETHPDLQGLYHVASLPISKCDLLTHLRDALGWNDISIEPDDEFVCDRSLNSMRFNTITGWLAPSWAAIISGLAKEWFKYKKWYPRYSN